MPPFEMPSNSEPVQPSVPTFEMPSNPEPVQPNMPPFEMPSNPEPVQQSVENNSPIYEVPIAPASNNIPVIDEPIEPSVNIGNTNVETFQQPQLTEQNNNSTIKAAVPNIKIALNTIRECENTLMKYGFSVDVEEIDFEDSYQVIFKIEK